jgi:hypothetical protein
MTDYAVQVTDGYVVPEGPLDAAQYVDFVMNRAAESYMSQYGTATVNEGIQAACNAYNSALSAPPVEEPVI